MLIHTVLDHHVKCVCYELQPKFKSHCSNPLPLWYLWSPFPSSFLLLLHWEVESPFPQNLSFLEKTLVWGKHCLLITFCPRITVCPYGPLWAIKTLPPNLPLSCLTSVSSDSPGTCPRQGLPELYPLFGWCAKYIVCWCLVLAKSQPTWSMETSYLEADPSNLGFVPWGAGGINMIPPNIANSLFPPTGTHIVCLPACP